MDEVDADGECDEDEDDGDDDGDDEDAEGYADEDDEGDDDEDDDDPRRFLLEEDSQAPNLVPDVNPRNVLAGRIEILDMIGQGGMGAVWRGHHLKLERPVAVKVLDETLQLRPDGRERFIREAQALAKLDHPGVVRVYDCDELPDGKLFLCMELLEGETLREVIKRGRLDALEVIDCGRQVCDAVEAAHQQGILHRDLSPSNIMRSGAAKKIKVIDWGLCKYLDLFYIRAAPKYPAPPGSRLVTPLGARFGTPEYMAPEMILRENPGPPSFRTDVYALGIVLYELLAGRHPFAPGDRRQPRPLREALPDFEHVELEAALRAAVRFEPEERTQTMAEFREALELAHVAVLRARSTAESMVDAAGVESWREVASPTLSAPAASGSATCLADSQAQAAALPAPALVARLAQPGARARYGSRWALFVGAGLGVLGTIALQRLGDPPDVRAETLAAQIEQEAARAGRCEAALEALESKRPAADRSPSTAEPAPTASGQPAADTSPPTAPTASEPPAADSPPPTTPSSAAKPKPKVLASRGSAAKEEPPPGPRKRVVADSGTFAQVMARLEPKLRSCARETGIAEAPITVQVRYKGDTLVGVRVHSLSKGHPFSACVEPAIRKANPPPGGSPVEDFTFLSGRSPTMK